MAIRRGLHVTIELGAAYVQFGTDSIEVVHLVEKEDSSSHILREANRYVDLLVKMGA